MYFSLVWLLDSRQLFTSLRAQKLFPSLKGWSFETEFGLVFSVLPQSTGTYHGNNRCHKKHIKHLQYIIRIQRENFDVLDLKQDQKTHYEYERQVSLILSSLVKHTVILSLRSLSRSPWTNNLSPIFIPLTPVMLHGSSFLLPAGRPRVRITYVPERCPERTRYTSRPQVARRRNLGHTYQCRVGKPRQHEPDNIS